MIKVIPKNALICDEIRQENNGKLIFIGVYTGDILASGFPLSLRLTAWMTLDLVQDEGGTVKLETRLTVRFDDSDLEDSTHVSEFQHEAEDVSEKTTTTINIAAGADGLELLGPATLQIDARKAGGKWTKFLEKKVRLNPETSANAP